MANMPWIYQQSLNVTAFRDTIKQISAAAQDERIFNESAAPTAQDTARIAEWHELLVHLKTLTSDCELAMRQIALIQEESYAKAVPCVD